MSRRRAAAAENADDQRNSGYRQSDRRHPLQRGLLQSACNGVEQHPDRSCVLDDDRGGNVRPLDRQIVEVVGGGHAQNADQQELRQVASGETQGLASANQVQDGEQQQERKCDAALGKNQGVEGVERPQPGKAPGERRAT